LAIVAAWCERVLPVDWTYNLRSSRQ
jgi:hypothetical protein